MRRPPATAGASILVIITYIPPRSIRLLFPPFRVSLLHTSSLLRARFGCFQKASAGVAYRGMARKMVMEARREFVLGGKGRDWANIKHRLTRPPRGPSVSRRGMRRTGPGYSRRRRLSRLGFPSSLSLSLLSPSGCDRAFDVLVFLLSVPVLG